MVENADNHVSDPHRTVVNTTQGPLGQHADSTLRVRCPHCNHLIATLKDDSLAGIVCNACGSNFSLVDPNDNTRAAAALKTVGHFDLIERLGIGAFGEVWKARDAKLDRTVAIKVPRKETLNSSEVEKFLNAPAPWSAAHGGVSSFPSG